MLMRSARVLAGSNAGCFRAGSFLPQTPGMFNVAAREDAGTPAVSRLTESRCFDFGLLRLPNLPRLGRNARHCIARINDTRSPRGEFLIIDARMIRRNQH